MDVAKTAKGVSPSATPQSPSVLLPNPVAVQRAAQAEIKQVKLSKVLNMAAQAKLKGAAAPVDIGRTTDRLWPGMFTKTSNTPDHSSHLPTLHFLAYARAFWMLHSAPMTEDDGPLFFLWSQVLTASDTKGWMTWETPYMASHGAGIPEAIIWAVVHSHNTLLETMLRKQKRRLRLLNTCLEAVWGMSPLPRLSPMMAARFLTLHLFLQRCSVSRTSRSSACIRISGTTTMHFFMRQSLRGTTMQPEPFSSTSAIQSFSTAYLTHSSSTASRVWMYI